MTKSFPSYYTTFSSSLRILVIFAMLASLWSFRKFSV